MQELGNIQLPLISTSDVPGEGGQTINKFFLVREKGTAVVASYVLYDNEVITESYKVRIIKAVK